MQRKYIGAVGALLLFVAGDAIAGAGRPGLPRFSSAATRATASVGVLDLSNLYSMRSTGAATDRMSTPDSAGLECGTQCSFGFRVRTDSGNVSADRYLAKTDDSVAQTFRIDTSAVSPYTVRVSLCADATCSAVYSVTSRAGATPSVLNLFTDVVVTVDYVAQQAIIYIDGAHQVQSIGGSFPSAWVDTASEWAVAANSLATGSREMSGWFDDVWIDPDHAWTPEEVYAWHTPPAGKRGSATMPPGISVATWCRGGDDNAGTGTTCTDYSGNGRNWTLAGSAVFASVVPAPITLATVAPMNRRRSVYVMVAQSNGGGRGDIADLGGSQADEFPNASRCYNYDNNGPIGAPNGTTNPCAEPWDVNTGQAAVFPITDDATTGVGPMVRTADRILQTFTQREVGIVPCALGNSNSYVFSTSHGGAVTANLYAECEGRIAQTAIGVDAELAGFIIYQGENDTSLQASEADEWDYRWQAYVEGYRDFLGRRDIPVVVVILPTPAGSGGGAQYELVRARQALVCSKIAYCTAVQAPTGYMVDGVHQTTAAQLSLGDTLGDAVLATPYNAALLAEQTSFAADTRAWSFDGCDTAGGCSATEEYTTVADNSVFNVGAHYTGISIYRVNTCVSGAACDDFVYVKGTNANSVFHQLVEFNASGSVSRSSVGGLLNFLQTGLIAANGTWIVAAATYDGTQADGGDAGSDANAERFSVLTKACPRTNGGQPVCAAFTDWTTTGTFNGTIPATAGTNALAFLTGGVPASPYNLGGDISEVVIFGDGKVSASDIDTCILDGSRARVRDLNAMSAPCAAIFAHPVIWLSYGDKSGDNPASQLGNKFSNAIGNSTPSAMEGAAAATIGDQFFHGN